MKYFSKTIVIFFILIIGVAIPECDSAQIRCPLVWMDYELSTGSPPSNAVPAYDGDKENFIIRGEDQNVGVYKIGRLDVNKGAYIVNNDGTVGTSILGLQIQILTNIHECDVDWVKSMPNAEFLTRANNSEQTKAVGRALVEYYYLSGEVDTQSRTLTVVNKTEDPAMVNDFEYLISTSDGLRLQFTNLTFSGQFNGMVEFLGIDEISNQGAGTIVQEVTHTKKIIKATKFQHDGRWAHCAEATFDFDIDMKLEVGSINLNSLGVSIYQTFRKEKLTSQPQSIGSEVEQDLTAVREIIVGSYSHVQACTLIGKINKFSNSFTATGQYSAKGWTGQEVFDYLKQQSNPPRDLNVLPDSNYTTSTESGVFSGELYLNNVMAVLDITPGVDCVELQKLFIRWNAIQLQGNKTTKVLQEEGEIEARITKILAIKQR